MPNNTVEATLRSKFEDGVTRGLEKAQKTLESALSNTRQASAAAAGGIEAAFQSAAGGLETFQQRLLQAAEESGTGFRSMGLFAAAMAVAVVAAAIKAGEAVAHFVFDLAKEASQALEVKVAFESLTAAQNENADLVLGKLKRATEGQVSGTLLMKDANRVMQSGIGVSMDMYARLSENVFRLAKAAGVDAVQAQNLLTDAVIRGNARGFQSIGLHLAVRDAVSAMAEASGAATGKLADQSKMQAFYNELLEKSSEAVKALGPEVRTIEDLLKQGDNAWRTYVGAIGVAIGRSGTLQKLLEKVGEKLLGLSQKKDDMDAITLATNRFIMSSLTGFQGFAAVLSATLEVANVFWGSMKALFAAGSTVVLAAIGGLTMIVEWFQATLDFLTPGDRQLRGALELVRRMNTTIKGAIESNIADINHAWEGALPAGSKKLDEMAQASARLQVQLQGTTEEILRGASEHKAHADAVGNDAEALKKLNEQLQKYRELRKELTERAGMTRGAAMQQLFADFGRIDQELTLQGIEWDRKRAELKMLALLAYEHKLDEIAKKEAEETKRQDDEVMRGQGEVFSHWQKQQAEKVRVELEGIERVLGAERRAQEIWDEAAKKREEARRKEVAEAIGAAAAIERSIDLASRGKLSSDTGLVALRSMPATVTLLQKKLDELRSKPILTEEQVEEVVKLETALDKLNRMNWGPFRKALDVMKQDIRQFVQGGVEAWANFWSALVQGQEGAGRKLLAAFVGMIGQMLVHIGVILIQSGIAEIALAQTLVGRMMGASVAGGLKAIAAGAIVAAVGGALQGAAASMSQPAQSASGGGGGSTAQQASSSSTTPVQVINVGAPGRAQNAGEAAAPPVKVELSLRLDDGLVAKQFVREVRGNNRELILSVQKAAN